MSCAAERGNTIGMRVVMTGMTRRLGLLVLTALVLAGCGSVAGSGGDQSPTPPTSVQVTMANDRQTLTVHVGDSVQIALGEKFTWQLDPPDGVVLVHPIQNYMLVRGTQAIWLAKSVGTSTIHATGGAVCPSGQACPMFAVLFTATVNVVP